MYKIVDSSPQANDVEPTTKFQSKYPWNGLTVGKSFTVPFADVKQATIVSYASRMAKKLGRKFKVIVHESNKLYEVARLPDKVEQAPQSVANETQTKDLWVQPKE